MTELEIAVAPMHRLCKKAGADRVSEAAAKELAKALEEIGVKVAKEALDFAMHAGRKTIKAEDIEIAAKKVMGKYSNTRFMISLLTVIASMIIFLNIKLLADIISGHSF